jgi:hypothetical protein
MPTSIFFGHPLEFPVFSSSAFWVRVKERYVSYLWSIELSPCSLSKTSAVKHSTQTLGQVKERQLSYSEKMVSMHIGQFDHSVIKIQTPVQERPFFPKLSQTYFSFSLHLFNLCSQNSSKLLSSFASQSIVVWPKWAISLSLGILILVRNSLGEGREEQGNSTHPSAFWENRRGEWATVK